MPVALTDGQGDTLLLAAYAPTPPTVRVLLERGADPDRVDERGQTAVVAAALRSSAEAVEALLAAGADPRLGAPDAVAAAQLSDLPDMGRLLTGSDVRGVRSDGEAPAPRPPARGRPPAGGDHVRRR